MQLFATLVFKLANLIFHSPVGRRSKWRHEWVMRLFRYAADHHNQSAQSVYGHLLFFRGDGPASREQGGRYLEMAAKQGDVKAHYQLARIYELGALQRFPRDAAQALSHYQVAAEQGHPLALKRLVEVYQQGELEQPVDQDKAAYWQQRQPALPRRPDPRR